MTPVRIAVVRKHARTGRGQSAGRRDDATVGACERYTGICIGEHGTGGEVIGFHQQLVRVDRSQNSLAYCR